jgi:hypothetical protein
MRKIKTFFCRLFGIIQPGDLVLCEFSFFEHMNSKIRETEKSLFYTALAIEKYKEYEIDRGIGMSGYYRKGWKVLVDEEIREIPKHRCWKYNSFGLKMSHVWITMMLEIVGGKK